MTTVTTKAVAKVAAVATGLAMATSMLSLAPMAHAAALTSAQISSIISLLQSFGADSTTIANVQASLTGGTPTGGSTGGSTSSSCSFTRNLTVGSTGSDVTCLQNALKAGGYMTVNATGYFGPATKAAVVAWQRAAGVSPTSGYFGALSRAAFGGTSGGNGGVVVGTGTGLKVMLASDSPSGSVLVQGQGIGRLAKFDFTNPTSAPITVTALTFKRIGVSNDTSLTNVYLYNAGTRITDSAGVSSSQFTFSNPSGIFTVAAGGVYTVTVRSDIAGSTSGQQIGVQLVAVSASSALDGSVSLPISSGYQTVSAATLAGVDFSGTLTPASNTTVTISPQNDYPVWQENVSVSTNPVKLSSMRFTNLGSINATDVSNFRLYVDGNMVGSAIPSLAADRSITFDLSASPVTLSQQSHTVKVLANITGGASRSLQLSLQRTADTMFVDAQLNQPVTPTVNSSAFSAQTAGTVSINSVSGSSGVSVSLAAGSPTQNVSVGATNIKWASFAMLASGENVKVQDLYVEADTSIHNGGLANGKVMVNGVQVGSTKNIAEGTGSAQAGTDFSLGSSLILPAGQTTNVDIYADAKTSTSTNLSNNETVKIWLDSATSNGQGQSSLQSVNVPSASTGGNSITVVTSSLTANKFSGYGNQTMVAGTNNAKIGAFTLSSGSTEGVTVNTIVITFPNAVSSTITNLTLKDDATGATLGTVQTTPSTSNSYSVNLDVAAGQTKTVDIYANILAGANIGTIVPSVGATTGGNGDTTGISASVGGSGVALQTISLGSGKLTVTRGAGDPVANNVLAGASSVKVGQFNFAAQNTSYTVQNLLVLVPSNAATSVTNVTLSYKDVNGATQTTTQALQLPTTSQGTATATFTGLTMYVPANDSANVDVYVGTPTIASGATSGAAINVTLDDGHGSNTFLATDAAGNTLSNFNSNNTNIASNGTFYVRKSIPTVAMIPLGITVPTSGSPIYKFSITADPAGAIEWTKLTFNVATSGSGMALTQVYLTDDSTGTNLLDNNSTSASTTQTAITVDLTKNNTQPEYQQVAAGATKTYDLYGTVAGFTTGASLSISLAADSTNVANAVPASVTGNMVWSDRSASPHTAPTFGGATPSADFTNGNLLKNFTSTAVTYSK